MKDIVISDAVKYIGADDKDLDLFESQYIVPNGVSYNSYVILDEKIAVMDTIDTRKTDEWKENLERVLDGRTPDYLVISHLEPDHAGSIKEFADKYPEAKIVASAKAIAMLPQFFEIADLADRAVAVKEGEELSLGSHTLQFFMAPMVHWPEVMVEYEKSEKILFSADGFGKFGALDADEDWTCEARRYYFNIVGKYGQQVQDVLAKAATVQINTICPLHGPVWRDNLPWIIEKYDKWSSYTPEDQGAVMVVYGSVYGGTENAANILAGKLSEGGVRNVAVYDVSKTHVSELIAEAFRCSHIVFASITYNMGIFTPMKNLLMDLQAHNLQNRSYALVENGSWSPASGKLMNEILMQMPDMRQVGDTVTILSTTNDESYKKLSDLATQLVQSLTGTPAPREEEPVAATQWRCKVCGFVYEGDALPEGYTCPICGVGADMFEKIS